jgi:hypothetical protein
MQTFPKQPADDLDYDVDFSAWLPDGDTILSATAVLDVTGELAVAAVQVSSPIVKVWLTGGVDKASYKVTVAASTAGGRVKETEFKIRVKDL